MRIDLNCDMGESFGAYSIGLDQDVIKHITSANVACGWHAGDAMVMDRTVQMAKENGVGIGAHPGYPDLIGFGRRSMDCTVSEITNYVVYQIGALQAFCAKHGVKLTHVKPHGSLYLTAVENEDVARAIAQAIVAVDPSLIYVALAGAKGEMAGKVGRDLDLQVRYEAFPDRAYTPEGTLASRRLPGAVVKDPNKVAARAVMMAKEGRVIALDGSVIELKADTLCLHGDTPQALELVRSIRARLEQSGCKLTPMGSQAPAE